MRSMLVLAFIVPVVGLALFSCGKSRWFERKIERQYCVPVDDDLGGNYFTYLSELQSGGEAARTALLNVADGEGPSRACAMSLLCELGDDRIAPVLEKVLHQHAAPPGTRDYSEQLVAVDCISKHGLTYASYVEDLLGFLGEGASLEARSLRILATVDSTAVREKLRRLLIDMAEVNGARQYGLVEAVGIQKDKKALESLLMIAQQPALDDAMRFQLAIALLRIQPVSNVEAIGMLIDGMDDVYLVSGRGEHILELLRNIGRQLEAAGRSRDADTIRSLINHIENLLTL